MRQRGEENETPKEPLLPLCPHPGAPGLETESSSGPATFSVGKNRTRQRGFVPSPVPGPKVAAKNPAASTRGHGPVTSEPGSLPASETGAEASSPDSATAWAAAQICGSCSVRSVPESALLRRLESAG